MCMLLSVEQPCVADHPIHPHTELATEAGYDLEEHMVTTDDGYILKLFRIPRGRDEAPSNTPKYAGIGCPHRQLHALRVVKLHTRCIRCIPHRPPVFLQHALLDSSCSWINQLANESLGFILADKGDL